MGQPFKKYSSYNDYINDVTNGIYNSVIYSIQYIDDVSNSKNFVVFRKGLFSSSEVIKTIDYAAIKGTINDKPLSEWISDNGKKITELVNKIINSGCITEEEFNRYIEEFPNYYLKYLNDTAEIIDYEDLPLYKINKNLYNISDSNSTKYGLYDNTTNKKIADVSLKLINPISNDESSEYLYSIGCLSDIHHDCDYDNDYYEHGGSEGGPQSASDLNNALHYFEKNKDIKFITVSGDLTVQQGGQKRPFVFNNFPNENGNDPSNENKYQEWTKFISLKDIYKVNSSIEAGCNIDGQTANITSDYYDFNFTAGGQRFVIDKNIIPNIIGTKTKICLTCSLIYDGKDVTEIFKTYYSNKGLSYVPVGLYSGDDGKYHLSGEYNGNIKSYSDFNYSGLEIGTSNSKIASYGWPSGYIVTSTKPITVRIFINEAAGPWFVTSNSSSEVLNYSWVADLDSFRYNAFEKISINTPLFCARGNHDIGSLREAHEIELSNRNALKGSIDSNVEALWGYYTNPANNKVIPSSLNITYQYPSKGIDKTNNANYYIEDTISKDIYIFFSLYNNDFWYGVNDPYKSEDFAWLVETLDEFRNRRTFVFLHLFFDDKCGSYKHIYPHWQNGSESPMYSNAQYLRLQWLSDYYKNSIWVSGHSHWRWCCQSEDENANVFHKSVNPELGEYGGWCIHIPSGVYPRTDNGTGWAQLDVDNASEGAVIDIYKDYIELHGIIFKDDCLNNNEISRLSPNTSTNGYINIKSGIANYRLHVGGKNLINIDSLI